MLREFRDFIARGSVVDLAVGIVVGAAFGRIVNSFVEDILMPPLGLLLGKADFASLFVDLSGKGYGSLAAARGQGAHAELRAVSEHHHQLPDHRLGRVSGGEGGQQDPAAGGACCGAERVPVLLHVHPCGREAVPSLHVRADSGNAVRPGTARCRGPVRVVEYSGPSAGRAAQPWRRRSPALNSPMRTLLAAVLLAAAVAAGAAPGPRPASAPAPPPIPYYPGGSVEVELTLTSDDLLPYAADLARALLGQIPPGRRETVQGNLTRALEGVRQVNFLQMSVAGTADPQQIIGFYTRIPANRQMSRVLRRVDARTGETILLYSGPQGRSLFGIRVARQQEGRTGWLVQAGEMEGTVQLQPLLELAGLRWRLSFEPPERDTAER